ncbi:hypothetical protein SLEP1_g47188 [Rubroshorea leprosula]|uniref:LysM domain-containing protein n=1 Tax=Rubroshorea leprosula TaxID=152421 RepID=A0AAV5LRJ1_9ROSI|nr:hypothetical protein SLEP1_g47188 [Rubroshorea leprosula]
MKHPPAQIHLPTVLHTLMVLVLISIPISNAKSMIEPCSSSDSCSSLLGYILPYDSELAEISYRFRINASDLLAANSISPKTLGDQIFHAKAFLRVPISCPCVDGIRRSLSTTYTVQAADTPDSISAGFGGLVSAEQIRDTNGINTQNPLMSGEKLVIPLPCTCFDNVNNGIASVYMSYVVQRGDGLGSIGAEFGVSTMNLVAVNGLGQPEVDPGDILSIPISACSSANLNWYNESLIVPNGSYALTANNCIKCSCGQHDLNLRCGTSGIATTCSQLQCKGSDLFIGDSHVNQTATGCNITTCVYRGHLGGKIFRSLANSSQAPCPGNQSSNAASPFSFDPGVPSIAISPSPSQSISPSTGALAPMSGQNFNISSNGRLLVTALSFSLLPLQLGILFLL